MARTGTARAPSPPRPVATSTFGASQTRYSYASHRRVAEVGPEAQTTGPDSQR